MRGECGKGVRAYGVWTLPAVHGGRGVGGRGGGEHAGDGGGGCGPGRRAPRAAPEHVGARRKVPTHAEHRGGGQGERDGVGRQRVYERREGGGRRWAGLNSSSSAKNASLSAGVSLAKTIAVRQDGAGSSLKSLFRVPRCLCALGLDGIAGHQSRKVSVCSIRSSGSAASQVFVSGEDRGHEGRVGTSERSDHGYKDRRKGCLD